MAGLGLPKGWRVGSCNFFLVLIIRVNFQGELSTHAGVSEFDKSVVYRSALNSKREKLASGNSIFRILLSYSTIIRLNFHFLMEHF